MVPRDITREAAGRLAGAGWPGRRSWLLLFRLLCLMTASQVLVSCGAAHPQVQTSYIPPPPSPRLEDLSSSATLLAASVTAPLAGLKGGEGSPVAAILAVEGPVPDTVVTAVAQALDRAGIEQVMAGDLLALTVRSQDLLQSSAFMPEERALLRQADVMVALTGKVNGVHLLLQARAVTLRPLEYKGRWLDAGEAVPGSHVSLPVSYNGARLSAGTGFCNKKLPRNRWRYSALRAAVLNAQAAFLYSMGAEIGSSARITPEGTLAGDSIEYRSLSPAPQGRIVGSWFDPVTCSASVLVAFR